MESSKIEVARYKRRPSHPFIKKRLFTSRDATSSCLHGMLEVGDGHTGRQTGELSECSEQYAIIPPNKLEKYVPNL